MLSRILNIWVIKQRAKPTDLSRPPPRRTNPSPLPRSGLSYHPLPPIPPSPRNPQASPTRLQKRTRPYSAASAATSAASSWTAKTSQNQEPLLFPPQLATLRIDLPDGRSASLRGMSDDLAAITATAWLAAKTHAQGYLEAAAKLIVYLVAALSGNQTQAGALVSLALLLLSGGLLALSNAHARGLRVNGRIAAPYVPASGPGRGGGGGGVAARWEQV